MAEIDSSLMLEHFKRIHDRLNRIEDKVDALAADNRAFKAQLAANLSGEVAQDTIIASLSTRLERVERRLDLRDEV